MGIRIGKGDEIRIHNQITPAGISVSGSILSHPGYAAFESARINLRDDLFPVISLGISSW